MAVRGEFVGGRLSEGAAVSFRDVSFARAGRVVLEKLTLKVEPGETLVLLGRSGSGKTTALKMVNGMLFPDSGEVLVNGEPTTTWDPIRLKRSIGYVIQETGLFPHFTVARNVGLGPSLDGWAPERIAARTREILEAVGLAPSEFAQRFPRELSGGQRQRVGVARALAANPALLLFDEPFGALDPITRFELQEQFLALRKSLGTTSVFVTHDVREALRLGNKIALLRDGQLEVIGSPDEFVRATTPEARSFLKSIRDN
jgi:osmoprotectant transport system ATP-binding protein